MFCIFEKNSKIKSGRHFWRVKYWLKLGKASFHIHPVKNFCEFTLSGMVFEIQIFLRFEIFAKNSKIQNGHHFWRGKYLLQLGKASLHRYPMGQKFYQNPTSKFLFYEENGFKKYLYIT